MAEHLNAPHGGILRDLLASPERVEEMRALSVKWPSWDLTRRQLCDLELLLHGASRGWTRVTAFQIRNPIHRAHVELIVRSKANGVRFLGMRRDVDRIYKGIDLFVLPRHREGFPRAAMDAAPSGLPVIAIDIRGCRQVVENGINRVLFPLKDVDALTHAIVRVGNDSELRSRTSQASVDRARLQFDEQGRGEFKVIEEALAAGQSLEARVELVDYQNFLLTRVDPSRTVIN